MTCINFWQPGILGRGSLSIGGHPPLDSWIRMRYALSYCYHGVTTQQNSVLDRRENLN
jgi:hypothetical protein